VVSACDEYSFDAGQVYDVAISDCQSAWPVSVSGTDGEGNTVA